jgi:hypothetical protein
MMEHVEQAVEGEEEFNRNLLHSRKLHVLLLVNRKIEIMHQYSIERHNNHGRLIRSV